ncbi:protein of unknown function [Burkholderia multivorans]
MLRMRHNRIGDLGVGRIFFRRKGTIWQNANALMVRRCSKSTQSGAAFFVPHQCYTPSNV